MTTLTRSKYGLKWPGDYCDLDIEFDMIRRNGRFTFKGKDVGLGLFHHYREAQKICWPDEDCHRWSDLILQTILEQRITVIMGCKDSGKTHGMSKYALIDYWAFPEITLILMSSTDVRGLELRVWGDIKDLFGRARERFPWLAGNVVDARHGIFTDSLGEEAEIRDMRKGIICFLKGTMIDTPQGPVAIENIELGERVLNACGVGTVKKVYSRLSPELVRVRLSNGSLIDCTPEHPFFTERGWTKAIALTTYDRVFSAYETMSLLSQSPRSGLSESEILLQSLPRKRIANEVQILRKRVSSLEATRGEILQHRMRGSLGFGDSASANESFGEVQALREKIFWSASEPQILFGEMPAENPATSMRRVWENISIHKAFAYPASKQILRHILQIEMDESEGGKEITFPNASRDIIEKAISRSGAASSNIHRSKISECALQHASSLRNRFGVSENQAGGRTGWGFSQITGKGNEGSGEDRISGEVRVVSVEVLEPTSRNGFDKSQGGYPVYNLEVDGHPSYSVGGVVVHNCIPCIGSNGVFQGIAKYCGLKQKRRRLLADESQFMQISFLDSLSNLDKGDFKGAFAGNPLGQGDPLDKMSEPQGGWSTVGEVTKTSVWKNKFDGVTINLVGIDSPNFDNPNEKPKYPYLIAPEDERRVVARWGKDSIQYYSQIMGVRKPGLNAHRVLTREICLKFHAFDELIWHGESTTRVYGIDASYGGDRCVGGFVEYGKDVNGSTMMKVHPPVIIPVTVGGEIPEDQISRFVRSDCERNNIPPENVFFDATGRGSLGTSFGRLWSNAVNPIEFGGHPTTRPVSHDTYVVDDRTRERRLKLANEHYSKFVTELWFSVRYTIESDQLRNLPQDVADEFYLREWCMVKGDKIELESKDETKSRMGCSPDLADWLAICVEGARRLGFRIERLTAPDAFDRDSFWLDREIQNHKRFVQKTELSYSA